MSLLPRLFRPVGLPSWCYMLSETWYSDHVNVFKWPMYTTNLLNRTRSRAGSQSMLIRDCIDGESIPDYSCLTENYEVPTIRANRNIFNCLLPDGNLPKFLWFLEEFLMFTNTNRYNLICGDDFSINMVQDSARKREMEIVIKLKGCINVITSPVRITLNSKTLLDSFITHFPLFNQSWCA